MQFRLTRMMAAAMGPVDVDGSFRKTFSRALDCIRRDREPMFVMLDAFVRDPLVNWRFVDDVMSDAALSPMPGSPSGDLEIPPVGHYESLRLHGHSSDEEDDEEHRGLGLPSGLVSPKSETSSARASMSRQSSGPRGEYGATTPAHAP